MPLGSNRQRRGVVSACMLAAAVLASSCAGGGRVFKPQPEYEEELYLALDGSATLNLNASVASLVALRGVDLPVDPQARVDRERVRALFQAPGADASVSLSRRDGRRFVHVSVDVDDLRTLQQMAPFAWSSYRFDRRGESMEYRQLVGPPTGKPLTGVGWDGSETVMFRMHVPSKIDFHNAPSKTVERGNILEWEQLLSERLQGAPVDVEVQMEAQSILSRTLLLFGATIVAAAILFAVVIWWVARRGRPSEVASP